MFLTSDELVELTGKHRKTAQCRSLFRLGIPYKLRDDGYPVAVAQTD